MFSKCQANIIFTLQANIDNIKLNCHSSISHQKTIRQKCPKKHWGVVVFSETNSQNLVLYVQLFIHESEQSTCIVATVRNHFFF